MTDMSGLRLIFMVDAKMDQRSQFISSLSMVFLRLRAVMLTLLVACGAQANETATLATNGSVVPILQTLIQDFATQSPGLKINLLLPPAGSGGAIKGVATGGVDLGVIARALNPDEANHKLEVVPWVRTAFVIVANHSGVVRSHTLDDLAAIWSGATTHWPDGQPIRLLLRSPEDADIIALRAMSPGMNRAVDIAFSRRGLPRADNDLSNLELLEKVPGAIGGSTFGLLKSSRSRLTALPVGGVVPGISTLKDGTYCCQRTLFLVSDGSPRSRPFITYLRSARAMTLLENNGYIAARP